MTFLRKVTSVLKERRKEAGLLLPAVLSLVAVTTFFITVKLASAEGGDFPAHIAFANMFFDGQTAITGYEPAFYWVYGLFARVFHIPDIYACAYANTVFSLLCAVSVYAVIGVFSKASRTERALATLFMMFFGPLYFAGLNGTNYYLGTYSFNTWHNPTNNSVKFIAVLTFYLFIVAFHMDEAEKIPILGRMAGKRALDVTVSILTCVSVWLKPSFFQVFAPALAVCFVMDFVQNRRSFKRYVREAIVFIPPALLILYQMKTLFFSEAPSGGGVEIAFLDVWSYWSPHVLLSVLAVTAFPIWVTAFCGSGSGMTGIMKYSWIFYVISCCKFAFLAEVGNRRYHGNFGWGMCLGIGIVTLSALMRFINYVHLEREDGRYRAAVFIGAALLSMQFFLGIWYYWRVLTTPVQCF